MRALGSIVFLLVIGLLVVLVAVQSERTARDAVTPDAGSRPAASATSSADAELERVPAEATREQFIANEMKKAAALLHPKAAGEDAEFRLRVVDRDTKTPLAGMFARLHSGPVTVSRYDSISGWNGDILRTDDEGRVTLHEPSYLRAEDIHVWDPSGPAGSTVFEIEDIDRLRTDEIVIELSPEQDFVCWLRVVDQDTHEPIAGARNSAAIDFRVPRPEIESSPFHDPNAGPTSGQDGLMKFSGPAWTRQTLLLDIPDHVAMEVRPSGEHRDPDHALLVDTPRNATLRLHLVHASGLPVASAKVSMTVRSKRFVRPVPDGPEAEGPARSWDGSTDEEGRAEIAGLPPGIPLSVASPSVVARKPLAPITLEPGGVRDVEWRLEGGNVVRGILLDPQGEPVPHREIWFSRTRSSLPTTFEGMYPARRATTDATGRFVLAAVESGRWWIGPGRARSPANGDPHAVSPFGASVEVDPDEPTEVELRVGVGLYVTGRVVPPDDQPLGEGRVVVEDRARGVSLESGWDTDGTFRVGPLMPGPMTVHAQSWSSHAPSEPLVVDAGAHEVLLQLRPGCSIRGWVTNSEGKPIQVDLLLSSRDDPSAPSRKLRTHKAGEFEMRGLLPGKYTVATSWWNQEIAEPQEVAVAGPARPGEVSLRTRPSTPIRVRYKTGSKSGRLEFEHERVRIMEIDLPAGNSGWYCLPPGRCTVRLHVAGTGEVIEQELDLRNQGANDVVFDAR